MGKSEKDEEKNSREALLLERKKITYNLVLLLAASFVVLIGVLTMAWFASNNKVDGTNMSVTVQTPENIQISVGRTNSEYSLNDSQDYFVLVTAAEAEANAELNEGEVHPPRESGEGSLNDWSDRIDVSEYYRFGRLMPASSESGEVIFFTPDSYEWGKNVEDEARYFLASGGKTDKNLKDYLGFNSDASDVSDRLMATVKAFTAGESKTGQFWGGTNAYRKARFWYDTNDDGYYIDIPVWLRTNCTYDVNLCVEGYVTNNADLAPGDVEGTYWLYKATRVAILKESNGALVPAISAGDADGEGSYKEQNIIDLQNHTSFGSTTRSILDSNNYRTTRLEDQTDSSLYGMRAASLSQGIKQDENYKAYDPYDGTSPVVTLAGATAGNDWGVAQKLIIRIWIDGEDGDCWNPSANQDWKINLKFKRIN